MKLSTVLIAALGASAARAGAFLGIEHVVILGVDGLGLNPLNDALAAKSVPNMIRLREHGTTTHQGLSVQPTYSLPNWMAIMSSGDPVVTSMDGNGWTPTASKTVQPVDGTCTYYPTLYSVLNKYEPDAVTGAWYYWDTLKYVFRPAKYTKLNKKVGTDNDAVNAFLADIKTVQPRVSFVYFGDIDETGHTWGYGTHYADQIKTTDGLIGKVLDGMKAAGMDYETNTLVVLVSDHGRNLFLGGYSHGYFTGQELNTQLIFAGPKNVIQQNKVIQVGVPNVDIAPTVLAVLGHNAPKQWTGRVTHDFFTDDASSKVRADQQDSARPAANAWAYVETEGIDQECLKH